MNPGPSSIVTAHTLRPHHISLVALIVILFKTPTNTGKPWSSTATLHVLRLLIEEVSELTSPRHFSELVADTRRDNTPGTDLYIIAETLQKSPECFRNSGALADLFDDLMRLLVLESDELSNAPIERRSFLGLFCRRCHLSYGKLSFSSVTRLQTEFCQWCQQPNRYEPRDCFENVDDVRKSMLFPTSADAEERIQTRPFETFEEGNIVGDISGSTEQIHRYFDQRFSPQSQSQLGLRQYALLHLAKLYFLWDRVQAARKFLQEAIAVSRSNGDKIALEHCVSLLRRLPKIKGEIVAETASPTSSSPLDILWDIQDLLQKNEPLSSCFIKLYRSIGAYDDLSVTEDKAFNQAPKDQFAQHCVQAHLWTFAGRDKLASIEENIVITFTEEGSDELRFNMICSKAKRLARRGDLKSALSLLLRVSTWRGLSLRHYRDWANETHRILALHKSRRFSKTSGPVGDPGYNPIVDGITSANVLDVTYLYDLQRCRQYQDIGETACAIHALLGSLWKAEQAGQFRYYRLAALTFADLGLDLGMEEESLKVMNCIITQVINGDDLEERAYACFTFARTLIMTGQAKELALRHALLYLDIAEDDYLKLEMMVSLNEVKNYKIMIYECLGRFEEQDETVKDHNSILSKEGSEMDIDIGAISRLVHLVGSVLANGAKAAQSA